MIKRNSLLITTLILLLSVAAIAVSLVYGYFFREYEIDDHDRTVGEVLVSSDVYFQNGATKTPGIFFETINNKVKPNTYYVDISNPTSVYHIDKLRIDFNVNSNIDTYFRIKLIDSLVIMNEKDGGLIIEEIVGARTEYIEFGIDEDDWYFDKNNAWYYYKNTANIETGLINFIQTGLSYPPQSIQHKIQLVVVIEAVQAHRGPIMNWGLPKRPWDQGDWT